ncbi:MAG TPA: hypothetical protein VF102_09785, partial [Gemmatimonadaceae bacterium]
MKCVVGGGIAIGLLLAVRAGAQQKQPSPHYGGTAERTTVPAASRATPSRATLSVDGVTLREALRVIAKE